MGRRRGCRPRCHGASDICHDGCHARSCAGRRHWRAEKNEAFRRCYYSPRAARLRDEHADAQACIATMHEVIDRANAMILAQAAKAFRANGII